MGMEQRAMKAEDGAFSGTQDSAAWKPNTGKKQWELIPPQKPLQAHHCPLSNQYTIPQNPKAQVDRLLKPVQILAMTPAFQLPPSKWDGRALEK